jgi:hypothetical protein
VVVVAKLYEEEIYGEDVVGKVAIKYISCDSTAMKVRWGHLGISTKSCL